MDLKLLARASKKIEVIKKLDQEIIELEKLAMMLADGNVGLRLSLTIEDFKKAAELEAKKAKEATAESIFSHLIYFSPFMTKPPEESATTNYSCIISESIALRLLGVLLGHKMAERQNLISEIAQMGFRV